MTALALVMISPFLWAISTSLRLPSQSFASAPTWLPTHFDLSNYRQLFDSIDFVGYLRNSLIVTGGIVVGQVALSSASGYAFARLDFPFKGTLFAFVIVTMLVPLQVTIVPLFLLARELHLLNSLTGLIVPVWPTAFGTFLMRQYFLRLPAEWGEAAEIDGASQRTIFWRVYLPLARPVMATVAVVAFYVYWNEFFRPLIFLNSESKFTLPLGMVSLQGQMGGGSISVILAGVVASVLPVCVVFLAAQRFLVSGITAGGLM